VPGSQASSLRESLRKAVPSLADAYGVQPAEVRIALVEAAPNLLPSMPEKLRVKAATILTELGVRLVLGSKVVTASAQDMTLASGDRLVGRTLVWTGGIMAPPLLAQSGLPTARNGQVVVDEYLRIPAFANVYAIGDAALIQMDGAGGVLEPTAQVAVKQAEAAATHRGRVDRMEAEAVRTGKQGSGRLARLCPRCCIDLQCLSRRPKVMALKTLIEEGYRYSVTGRIDLSRL